MLELKAKNSSDHGMLREIIDVYLLNFFFMYLLLLFYYFFYVDHFFFVKCFALLCKYVMSGHTRVLLLKFPTTIFLVYRLEEKEQESKKEYNKLHERYTELFKTHMDLIERTKLMSSGDRIDVHSRQRMSNLPFSQMNR